MNSRIHPFSVVAAHRRSGESQPLDLSGHGIHAPTPVASLGLSVGLSTETYIDMQVTRGRDQIERGWSVAGRVGF